MSVEKIQVSVKSYKNNGYITPDRHSFLIVSHSVLLRMINVSVRSFRKNQNKHFGFNDFFFFFILFYCAVHKVMWTNTVEPGSPQTIWCMCIVCRVPKVTDTHSEYVTLIAFLHVHCLSCILYSF